jgi:predicted glycogen debranching enzyme
VDDYCTVTGSRDFLSRRIRKDETLFDILSSLADSYISGTPNGIRMDPGSGLIFSPPHFTWMDTNYPAGTPREGYPVEIQALWYSALKFLASAGHDPQQNEKRLALAEKVRESFLKYFVLPDIPYLSDCLHAAPGTPAAKAVADDHLRPNQLLAVTLGLVNDPALKKSILRATQELLVPGAIRSLADRRFRYELPVRSADGTLLNDPRHPYFGHYEGDEDTRRKPAYHNGTAWTWLFPSWAEACAMTLGEDGRRTACSVLSTMILLMDGGCITHIPEIVDGDLPHKPRGCDAQAWGITEFYRVWTLLHRKKGESAS